MEITREMRQIPAKSHPPSPVLASLGVGVCLSTRYTVDDSDDAMEDAEEPTIEGEDAEKVC